VLGVSWDGTGYGLDATVWGGEFLLAGKASFTRVAHFRQFSLPGGDAAIKEPRRSALGVLHEIFGIELWNQREFITDFSESEIALLRQMLEKKINVPMTSSVGRLFDAVASLTGLRHRSSFEGQAAMELEFALRADVADAYPFDLQDGSPMIVDWAFTIRNIVSDLGKQTPVAIISAKFHNMLTETIVAVAKKNWRIQDRTQRRMFSKSISDRTHRRSSALGESSALLAPANSAERRWYRPRPGGRCGLGPKVMNLVYWGKVRGGRPLKNLRSD
jgi:hydrogenase maturation protein HypF